MAYGNGMTTNVIMSCAIDIFKIASCTNTIELQPHLGQLGPLCSGPLQHFEMAPMTRAQRRKAAGVPAPPTLSPPNTRWKAGRLPTPADPILAPTTPRSNPRPPAIMAIPSSDLTALSTSDHTTRRLTRSEAGRIYPPPLPTPIRVPTLDSSTPLTLEAIAANQEILARNVGALHDRMERIDSLLQEFIRGQNERAEGYRLLEEQEVQRWSPRDYPRDKMKWEFVDQDLAKIYGTGAESEDRARERRNKRPAVGDSPKTPMTKVLMKERRGKGKSVRAVKRKAEDLDDGMPAEEVKRRAVGSWKGKGRAKEE
ncbi:hypothetical protein RUND412_001961 [Rhizina undulata]